MLEVPHTPMPMNTLQLLERLIAFPTVSRDSNLDLIGFASDYLRARGATLRFVVLDGLARPSTLDGPDEALLRRAYEEVLPT